MRDETASAAPAGANEEIFNWGAVAMHAREAEAVNVKRTPATVAVVDSGVEETHPDLEGRVDTSRSVKCSVNGVATQDFYGWRDEFYHGTHVAGPIAAKHDGVGVDGVNPTLRIAAINVASRNGGFFYPEYIVCGFVWAAEHGISVTNGSYYVDPWKYWLPNDLEQAAGQEAVQRAVDYATLKDVINVVAAGNFSTDLDNLPTTDDSAPGGPSRGEKGVSLLNCHYAFDSARREFRIRYFYE